MKYMVF